MNFTRNRLTPGLFPKHFPAPKKFAGDYGNDSIFVGADVDSRAQFDVEIVSADAMRLVTLETGEARTGVVRFVVFPLEVVASMGSVGRSGPAPHLTGPPPEPSAPVRDLPRPPLPTLAQPGARGSGATHNARGRLAR